MGDIEKKEDDLIPALEIELTRLIEQRESLKEQYHQTVGAIKATEGLITMFEVKPEDAEKTAYDK